MTWGETSGKLKGFSYPAIEHDDAKCTINHDVVGVCIFFFCQTEKELSKLMTRAMTEGLEGLVLKDVNVMSTKVPFMLVTCIFCVIYMELYMFYEIKLLNSIPLFFFLSGDISVAIGNDEECNGYRQDNSMILMKKWTAFSLVNTRMRKERLTAAILANLLKLCPWWKRFAEENQCTNHAQRKFCRVVLPVTSRF